MKIEGFSGRPLKEIQGRFKGLKGCFKEVSRQFQRHLKKVSSVFKESVKCVSRKFHKKLLHESHCSYPSRRRDCLINKKVDDIGSASAGI